MLEHIVDSLADRAEAMKPATLTRHLTAIGAVHAEAGLQNPAHASIVRLTMAGIKRTKGTRQNAKAPFKVEDLRKLMAMDVFHGLTGLRDRALLLLGFAAALRRAELASVRAEDLTFGGAGAVLFLLRSKGDQEGAGAEIVKRYAARLGYDESLFSGHSLRRGFATEASRSGASLPAIMHHTRHKSERQALKYVIPIKC